MGRGVSYPSNASIICFRTIEEDTVEAIDFDYLIEDIRNMAQSEWESFYSCDDWLGREDHAILENRFCYVGVSEYCGTVSIWVVPKEDEYGNISNLADHWISIIKPKFEKMFGQYRRLATMSNGESVYEKIEA